MKSITVARWVSLIAAFVWGAVAEYKLATAVGADQFTAALLPVVLDVYGFAAFRMGRTAHVTGALTAMFATQMVSHLLTLGASNVLHVALSIGVSAIPPAVSLACHRLGEHAPADDTVSAPAASVDAPAELDLTTVVPAFPATVTTVDAPVYVSEGDTLTAVSVPVDTVAETPAQIAGERSKAELAARGAELIAELGTKTAAAAELGISRQWLHRCMVESGLA